MPGYFGDLLRRAIDLTLSSYGESWESLTVTMVTAALVWGVLRWRSGGWAAVVRLPVGWGATIREASVALLVGAAILLVVFAVSLVRAAHARDAEAQQQISSLTAENLRLKSQPPRIVTPPPAATSTTILIQPDTRRALLQLSQDEVVRTDESQRLRIRLFLKNFGDKATTATVNMRVFINSEPFKMDGPYPATTEYAPGLERPHILLWSETPEDWSALWKGTRTLDIELSASYVTEAETKRHYVVRTRLNPDTNRMTILEETVRGS